MSLFLNPRAVVFTLFVLALPLSAQADEKERCEESFKGILKSQKHSFDQAFSKNSRQFEHLVLRMDEMVNDLNSDDRNALLDFDRLPAASKAAQLPAFWAKAGKHFAGPLRPKGDCPYGSLRAGDSSDAVNMKSYMRHYDNVPPRPYTSYSEYQHDQTFLGFFEPQIGYGCVDASSRGLFESDHYTGDPAKSLEEFKFEVREAGLVLIGCEYSTGPLVPACVEVVLNRDTIAKGSIRAKLLGTNKKKSVIDEETFRAALAHPKAVAFAKARDEFPSYSKDKEETTPMAGLDEVRQAPRAFLAAKVQKDLPSCKPYLETPKPVAPLVQASMSDSGRVEGRPSCAAR